MYDPSYGSAAQSVSPSVCYSYISIYLYILFYSILFYSILSIFLSLSIYIYIERERNINIDR